VNRRVAWIWLVAIGALLLSPTVSATSLWSGGGSMFADQKARRVGDLLTLIIVERSAATQKAATQVSQDGEVRVGPGLGILASVIPLISASGSDSSSAGGSTTRGGSLEAKMTTKVVEVLDNDVLRIEGRQTIVINDEKQEIVVTGLVRTRDISPDNTVLSTYVADAHITFVGGGSLGVKQKPGLLTRLFDWLL